MGKGQRSKKRPVDRGDVAADVLLASRLADQQRFEEAIPLLRQALEVRDSPALRSALGDCLRALGRVDEARAEYARAAPHHAGAAARLGLLFASEGRFEEALPWLRQGGTKDPGACLARAYVELHTSHWIEAADAAHAALRLLANGAPEREDAALFAGLALAGQGRLADAASELVDAQSDLGRTLAARFELLGGDLGRAVQGFGRLEAEGKLSADDLGQAALAAAWSGDGETAQRYVERAQREAPGLGSQLAAAQVALARQDPSRALDSLPPEDAAIADAADAAMARLLRARALRQIGRITFAPAGLADLGPDVPPRIRALALVEAGHAHADRGEFEDAERRFEAALALDASLGEASRARALAQQRLSWKRELQEGAGREVVAARAEAEALRRTFAERESEIEVLKRQLAAVERQRREAERAATESRAQAAQVIADAEGREKALLREELDAREAEAAEKTEAELSRAFAGRLEHVPPAMVHIVRQAERMFQKGLQTDLPGAGVAVLYSGALERALYVTIVTELDRYLDREDLREAFLASGRTTDRAGRPSYLDHFVGAFDRAHPGRAPGLGEVARVLARRSESHLVLLRRFLEEDRGWTPAFLDALGEYLEQVKVRLRDPVAHGRILDIGEREVTELRASLLHRFQEGPGILYRLAFPR